MIDIKNIAKNYLAEHKAALDSISLDDLQRITQVLLNAYKKEKTVFVLGVGGAATTASHMACDLGKGTLKNVYNQKEKRFRVVSLTDNVATMTAFANDLSFDDMFVQQLHNLIKPGDVVIGISGSGNTPNVIKALMYAKQQGATTIGLLGYHTGGKAREFVDYDITIQSANYGIIEDLHLMLDHILTTCLSFMKEHADSKLVLTNNKKDKIAKKKISPKSYIAAEWIERSARR